MNNVCQDTKPNAARDAGRENAVGVCVMKSALVKLDECRMTCPGAGGDIDASNLRYMIRNGFLSQSTIRQAARTLENLSVPMEIDATTEVVALLEVASHLDSVPL